MKKVLSLLLCSLLIMSSMATVAFADTPEVITFGEYLAKLPAGSKIIVNTGDVAEGNTVVATINGSERTLVLTDGYYAVTVPAGDNSISVAVKNGDAVVAQTETIKVFGVSYMGEAERTQETTWETDTTGEVGNKLGYYDFGMNKAWYDGNLNITSPRVAIANEEGNQYLSIFTWGTAASDPHTGEGYTKVVNGGGTQLASAVDSGKLNNVAEISVDYRFDKVDVIDPETGATTQTFTMTTPDEIKAARTADNGTATLADCQVLTVQYLFSDPTDYDNGNDTGEERVGFSYWTLNLTQGKPQFTAYNADGSAKTVLIDNFNAGWNNYKVIIDIPNDTVYGYINDIFVASGHLAGVKYATGHEKEGQTLLVEPRAATWPYIKNLRPYNSTDVVAYASADDFIVDVYANGFASTEPTVEVTNGTTAEVLPAGSKLQLSAVAANIPAGGAVAAFVNGVRCDLTATGVTYNYNTPLAAGYTSIYVAMVDADGNIVVDSDGNEVKSDEWAYYAFAPEGDVTTRHDFNAATDFPTYAEYSASSGDTLRGYNALFAAVGIGSTEYFTHTDYAAYKSVAGASNKVNVAGTDDKYFTITSWGSKYADPVYTTNPSAARKDGAGPVFVSSYRSGDTGSATVDRFFDMSIDYRAEKIETTTVTTGVLEKTTVITSSEDIKNEWRWAEWNIMDTQLVWDSDYSGLRGTKTLFGINNQGKVYANTFNGTTAVPTVVDVNPGEWHNYRAIIDIVEDEIYLLVDDVLVAQGSLGTYKTSTTDVTEFLWPHVINARQYAADTEAATGNWTYSKRITANFDNWKVVSYGVGDAPTEAIINAAITAEGATLGIIPANLGLAEDAVMTIAVIARAASGEIEMQKYEDVTAESSYKAFGFEMEGIDKVFVWNWDTLKNIAVIE
ncbi:MAG: hypothetical protein IKB50_00640 [Clostridia bacterium]|nr:hypothetical protein [Clostridia bacterium]